MNGLLNLLVSQPQRESVVADSFCSLSLANLGEQVRILKNLLLHSGCRRLGLHADNSAAWVVADLACQEAGIVCVPLPLFFTWQQTLHAVHTCGIDTILTAEPKLFGAHFQRMNENTVCFGLTLLRRPLTQAPLLPLGTGKVTFTSGSTGAPRGVCLSSAQQLLQAEALKDAVGIVNPVHLCVLPLATLLENIAGVYAPLLAHGTVVLRSMAELGFIGSQLAIPHKFLQAIAEVRPDTLILIPQLLQLLITAVKQGWRPPPLKFIAVGGASVSAQLVDEARRLGLPVYEGYGLTECASVVSLNTPHKDRAGSSGKPLRHLQIEFQNSEIIVKGITMLGYLDEPKSWYRTHIATGDLGELDENGFLHITGRRKNLLISSYGRNISPEWVESELLASSVLREAIVFGDARPHCIALLSPARQEFDDSAIAVAVNAANARLPDYARVRQWLRLPAPLGTVTGLLTTNGRPVRANIFRHYQADIEALYLRAAVQEQMYLDHDEVTP